MVYKNPTYQFDYQKKSIPWSKRGDLIQVFKIIHGFDNLIRTDFFELYRDSVRPTTRGHEWRIMIPHTHTVRRRIFFDIRVINQWNELPENVVNCQSISTFKKNLDRHLQYMRGGASTSE